ncbi:MAG: tetratricopeptide repeat protein [Acidobacteriaceae bacterium]
MRAKVVNTRNRLDLKVVLLASLLCQAAVRVVAAPLPSGQQPSPAAQAEAALDRGNPEEAINLLSAHLRAHPTDDTAHLLLAAAFVMTRQADAAEAEYRKVLKHAPNNCIALAGLGELYESMSKLEKAEPMFAQAVKCNPREPRLRIEWARALTRLHRFSEASKTLVRVTPPPANEQRILFFRLKAAIAEGLGDPAEAAGNMESALSVRPTSNELQMAAAVANLHAQKWKRAGRLAQNVFAETLNPVSGIILLEAQLGDRSDPTQTLQSLRRLAIPPEQELAVRQQLAEVLISHGETTEAIVDLKRATELDSANPDTLFNLALAEFRAGKTKEALASAENCKKIKDSAELEGLLGDIQEALGDNLAAVRSYQTALAMAPEVENHHLALALEFIRHRNFEPAKLVLEQAEKTYPNSWRVQVGLGMVEYFVGTKEAASKILLRAMDLASDPELALRYLGEVELDETAAPDPPAVERICAFARTHPSSARAQSYCGALMFRNDFASRDNSRVDDIVRRLSFAAASLKDDPTPYCELGKVYDWLEKWEQASKEFEACTRLNPNSVQAHYRLSQIYRHLGEMERSREELKLYKAASQKLAEENEQHETTLNTFLYTIQKSEQ